MRRMIRAEMQAVEKRIIKEHNEKLEAQRKKQAELRKKQDDLDSIAFQQKLKEREIQWQKERNELRDFISRNKVDTSENLTTTKEQTQQKELTDKEKRIRESNSRIISIGDDLKGEIQDLANVNDYGIQFKKPNGSEITLTFDKAENQNTPYDKYVSTFYLKNTKDNTTYTITIDRKGKLYFNGELKWGSEAEEIMINLYENTLQFDKYWTKKMLDKQQEEDTDNADKWADEMLNRI